MLVRKLGVVAISAALLMGATGCSITSNVATKKVYAPSDGNQVDAGTLHARNVLVLSDGTNAYIIGSIVNDGDQAAIATIETTATVPVDQAADFQPATTKLTTFDVPAQGKVDFGYPAALGFKGSQPGIKLEGTLPAVGDNIQIVLNGTATAEVQVLDGTIPTYADLMPFLEPTPAATAATK